jgi:hypothetical protein
MGSGFKTFTAASVLTAADLNNYCQNQSVMYFATTTARDAAITAPVDGMVAYVGSNDASEGLYTYNGTSWRKGPGWNAPWGVLGVSLTTATTSSTTATVIDTGLSVAFSHVANRRYRYSYSVHAFASVAGLVDAQVTDSSNVAVANSASRVQIPGSSQISMLTKVFYFSPTTSASVTHKVRFSASVSSQIYGDANYSNSFIIEDIGPSGAPA